MYVNEAFCRMTGYDQDEILGRNCRFLQGPETDKSSLARIRIAMQQARRHLSQRACLQRMQCTCDQSPLALVFLQPGH